MAIVRPYTNADLEGVSRLRTRTFAGYPEAWYTDWQSSVWRWLKTHQLADEIHRWVVATDDGEVVGHLAALPQYYRIGGERVIAHTPADYQILPEHGFHALSLMRRFFRTAENCVSCDEAATVIGIQTRMGVQEVGTLRHTVKVNNVTALAGFSMAPAPIPQILQTGLMTLDGILGGVFAHGPQAEVLSGFDHTAFDDLFETIADTLPCVPEKDATFLRWRYGSGSPQYPVTVLGVRPEGDLLGYAVLQVTADGDNGWVLDLTTRPGRHDVARSLLKGVIRHFARAGVRVVRYRFLESPTAPRTEDLWRLGFFPRNKPGHRLLLLVKFADREQHKAALDSDNWSYSIGDGEATFWIR